MIGITAHRRSFGLEFFSEDYLADHQPVNLGFKSRVVVSDHRLGLLPELADRSVALVGNGTLKGCGEKIDSHDEVVRITTMRAWSSAASEHGLRITVWAGMPAFVIGRNNTGSLEALSPFQDVARTGVKLWSASPFHISLDSYEWFRSKRLLELLRVAPAPMELYEGACSYMSGEDLSDLYFIPRRQHIIGLSNFDLLLTGTRTALLLEMSGCRRLSLFGLDFFESSPDSVWFGHDLATDFRTLMRLAIRIRKSGREFYWHEAPRVARRAIVENWCSPQQFEELGW